MRHWSRYIIGLILIALSACSHEDEAGQEAILHPAQGFLLRLTDDTDVSSSRGTPAELGIPTATQFSLSVHSHKTDKDIYAGPYTEEFISASAGTYTLTAICGEDVALAMDAPYYYGSTDAEVLKDDTTQVTISCRVANSLISIVYANAELFDQLYTTYGVQVKVGNHSLTIDSETHAGRSAYFPALSTEVSATFVATTIGGTAVEFPLDELQTRLPLAAADHAVITLKSSNTGLQVEKVEVKKESIAATIPLEWYPKPKVNGFAEGVISLEYIETEDALTTAIIDYTASTPTQDVELTLNLGDENLSSLNGTYLLSALTDEQRTVITNAGITLPTLGNQGDGISLNALTTKLITRAGADVINKVGIRVKANNRWSSETPQEYQVVTKKPEFTVDVLPGNIWTKEFTISEAVITKGNAERMSSQFEYQMSTDNGKTWITLNSLYKNNLISGANYAVRGLYRGCIASPIINFATYVPIVLANGGMEEWSYADGPKGNIFVGGPHWKRWWAKFDKNESTEGWCTMNGLTTRDNDPLAYRSNSGTERSETKNSGSYSAEIKTIGWGSGTTAASPLSTIKQNTPGELFLGTVDANYNATYGISYISKPTAVKFYYIYYPNGNHKFKAEISLLNGSNVIASNTFEGSNNGDNFSEVNLDFNYDLNKYNLAPLQLSIKFNSGENTNNEVDKASITPTSRHVGNKLYIDDVSLVYDK